VNYGLGWIPLFPSVILELSDNSMLLGQLSGRLVSDRSTDLNIHISYDPGPLGLGLIASS
jgi:hypothetical protein